MYYIRSIVMRICSDYMIFIWRNIMFTKNGQCCDKDMQQLSSM